MTSRIRAWLWGRPQPHQPQRRIVTIAQLTAAIGVVVVLNTLPPGPVLRVLEVVAPVVTVAGAAVIVLIAWDARRRRRRPARRSTSLIAGDETLPEWERELLERNWRRDHPEET